MRSYILFIFIFICFDSRAQVDLIPERFDFDADLVYDAEIKSPEDFLGYKLGESFTLYAHVVQYFLYLAERSDRMTINHYGTTYEGRKLYNVVITSPKNHAQIEDIRRRNLKLGDPRSVSAGEAEAIIREKPVFVSYSYNIHGNEASSTEAAMQVSYRYVAAQDDQTMKVLDNAILIFYICINPDGRDRFVYWFESVKRSIPAAEPRDMEHLEPWPGGRTNHYWFDLNRDWIWGVHPESRGHTAEYLKWQPQLHTDYHEQGYNSNYFTMPGTTPRNKLLPDNYEAYSDTIGRANIAALNANKVNYFTREAFDFFYPGYGSSWPSVMNAIGMLTEQGGGASRAIETDDGYILTLRQRIWDHYTTSVATIDKAVEKKLMFNRYFYEAADHRNSKSPTKAYLIEDGDMYTDDVIQMLLRNEVEVERLASAADLSEVLEYRSGRHISKRFPEGTYIIKTDQPRHLFIHSVLSPQLFIEDSVMYDMSTWSAPLAYNLEGYSTEENIIVDVARVTVIEPEKGKVIDPEAKYAYLIDWNQRNAPRALSMLWDKHYRVRVAQEGFSDGSRDYGPGTIIVLLGRNLDKSSSWQIDMKEIAEKTGVIINGAHTGRMESGRDLASRQSHPLKAPKVALLVDRPFSSYTCGQIYFLFDQETKFPIQRIPANMLNQSALPKFGSRYGTADLSEFDVLIVPGGSRLTQVFDEKAQDHVKSWIQAGGTLVATEEAAVLFTDSGDGKGLTPVKTIKSPEDTSRTGKILRFEDRDEYFGKKRIPGAALNAQVDVTHPLAFGMKRSLYSLKFDIDGLLPQLRLESVGRYADDSSQLLAAGYASEENLQLLAGNTFAGVSRLGRGKVVFLVDNTQYRMFWRGPSRMMQNAVMILPFVQ